MNIGYDFSRIFEAEKYDVVDALLHISHALPANGKGLRIPQPILDNADVMRSEVPERIDIRANAAKVQALAVNVTYLSQFAGIDQFLHVPNRRVVNERMASHHN